MNVRWLGTEIDFSEALALQDGLVQARVRGEIPDTLLLLEHAPVYTIGRIKDQSSLREISALPHPVVEINRGGQATYHGPGQLVGYPIIDLRNHGRDLHAYLRSLEESLILALKELDVPASRRDGLTGVWADKRKLASIGVGVRKWISMHGFALNVTKASLAGFQSITPCGIADVTMTCVSSETAEEVTTERLGERVSQKLQGLLGT